MLLGSTWSCIPTAGHGTLHDQLPICVGSPVMVTGKSASCALIVPLDALKVADSVGEGESEVSGRSEVAAPKPVATAPAVLNAHRLIMVEGGVIPTPVDVAKKLTRKSPPWPAGMVTEGAVGFVVDVSTWPLLASIGLVGSMLP